MANVVFSTMLTNFEGNLGGLYCHKECFEMKIRATIKYFRNFQTREKILFFHKDESVQSLNNSFFPTPMKGIYLVWQKERTASNFFGGK